MIFKIPDILAPEELEYITSSLADAEFVDGKLTAGWHAKLVKNNQQLKHSESQQNLRNLLKKHSAVMRCSRWQFAPRLSIPFCLAATTQVCLTADTQTMP
jgi:PKHD-type hydroxylase